MTSFLTSFAVYVRLERLVGKAGTSGELRLESDDTRWD